MHHGVGPIKAILWESAKGRLGVRNEERANSKENNFARCYLLFVIALEV
jgi:hypothetical protein